MVRTVCYTGVQWGGDEQSEMSKTMQSESVPDDGMDSLSTSEGNMAKGS